MKNLKPITITYLDSPDLTKNLYNLSLAIDYMINFYKQSLYNRAKALFNKIDQSKVVSAHLANVEERYVSTNIDDNMRLLSEAQTLSGQIYHLYLNNIDIRQSLIRISLIIDILAQRKIISRANATLIINGITNILNADPVEEVVGDEYYQADPAYINKYNIFEDLHTGGDNNPDDEVKDIMSKSRNFYQYNVNEDIKTRYKDIEDFKKQKDNTDYEKDNIYRGQSYNKYNTQSVKDNYDFTVKDNQDYEEADSQDNDRFNARKAMIINALRSGENMSIKDIADRVPGCSEKTIQRDLNALLDNGLIKKMGEKRWSRYSI